MPGLRYGIRFSSAGSRRAGCLQRTARLHHRHLEARLLLDCPAVEFTVDLLPLLKVLSLLPALQCLQLARADRADNDIVLRPGMHRWRAGKQRCGEQDSEL
jgi:hypothetical protein